MGASISRENPGLGGARGFTILIPFVCCKEMQLTACFGVVSADSQSALATRVMCDGRDDVPADEKQSAVFARYRVMT
jgi:hypothetical protein